MPVISAPLDGVLMLIVENGNLHETRNLVTIMPSYQVTHNQTASHRDTVCCHIRGSNKL